MTKVKAVLFLLSATTLYLLPQAGSMAVESQPLSRQKRTIISGIRSWWNGDSTSTTTTERPDIDEYSYRDAPAFYGYSVAQELPQTVAAAYEPQMMNELPVVDEDLGRLAKDLGIKNLQNLPRIEDVMGLLGTKTKWETIEAIREFAKTPGGVGVIESFLAGDGDDDEDDDTETEVIENNRIDLPVEGMEYSESAPNAQAVIDNSDRRGFQRQMSVNGQPTPYDPEQDREKTNNDILKNVSLQPSGGFFQRIGYYMGMLNPFAGTREIDVPTPTDEVPIVTVMPPKYIYPDGYDPVTKTFTTKTGPAKNVVDGGVRFMRPSLVHIPTADVQKVLSQANGRVVSSYPFMNTPIPFVYQTASNNGKYPQPVPNRQQQQYPGIPVVPFRVDMNDEEFSPDQINALREQLYKQRLQEVKNLGIYRGPYPHQQLMFGAPHPGFSLAPAAAMPINVPVSTLQSQGLTPSYLMPAYPQQVQGYPPAQVGSKPNFDSEPGASLVHLNMFKPAEPEQSLAAHEPEKEEVDVVEVENDVKIDDEPRIDDQVLETVSEEEPLNDLESIEAQNKITEASVDDAVEEIKLTSTPPSTAVIDPTTPTVPKIDESQPTEEPVQPKPQTTTSKIRLSPVPVYSSRGKSITRLSPINVLESDRPMRLSTPDFEPGAVYKTDPEALESAINAVKVLPPPHQGQPLDDDFQKMFSEVTKLTMQSLEEDKHVEEN